MGDKGKILVVTPRFPIPTAGACEQDRMEGILQLKRLGFEVRVIGKVFDFQDKNKIEAFSKESGIPIETVPYIYSQEKNFFEKVLYYVKRLFWPPYWDGAVYEYAGKVTLQKMEEVLKDFRPDVVWFDYTFMLPLYPLARRYGAKIITHSLIYDPKNVLEEDGYTWHNYVSSFLKTVTDYICIRKSDYMFAIAPDEKKMYEKLGAKKIELLPLRKLYDLLGRNSAVRDRSPLHVFFIGSAYSIAHNLQFARFIINEIAPMAHTAYPGKFKFFLTGRKLPQDLQDACIKNGVQYLGFVEDFEKFLADMDVALIPSLSGTGMQQKIFEPLSRGFPVITSKRGLAEYPFECGQEILCAVKAEEFLAQLGKVLDHSFRKNLAQNALKKSTELFARSISDEKVKRAIAEVRK